VNEHQSGNLAVWQQYVWGSVSRDGNYHYGGMVADQAPFSQGQPNYIVHKLLYNIVAEGLAGDELYTLNQAETMLNRGEIACMAADWDTIADIQNADTNPDDIGYMPFPYSVNGVQYATATLGAGYAISKNSTNKATARAWINYMLDKSGFAVSQGAISIQQDGELPTLLTNFENVELIVDNVPESETMEAYVKKESDSGLELETDGEKKRIVEAARKEREAAGEEETTTEQVNHDEETETFEEIMEDWNLRWVLGK
jgi:spermidine/putrescine-binding protein